MTLLTKLNMIPTKNYTKNQNKQQKVLRHTQSYVSTNEFEI